MTLVCAARSAQAGTVVFDNGVTGDGFMHVAPDDYGVYGFLPGQNFDDEYYAPGITNKFSPTYLTGVELYITTTGGHTSSVLLNEYKFWSDFVENPPPTPDGILADPAHTNLTRMVTTPIALAGPNHATSAFRVATDTQAGIRLDFTLDQALSPGATPLTSQLDQIYAITNNGTTQVDLVFHLAWDPDLTYTQTNSSGDDVVGSVPGLCGVYAHDGDPRWGVALGNGPTSTVPMAYYFAGKKGFVPDAAPPFAPISAVDAEQYIWLAKGMPLSWRNYVAGVGRNAVGESPTTLSGDATLGIEYRFPVAIGATQTIHIRRYYGTHEVSCFVSTKCGDTVVDPGEACDTVDTPTCNGATCTANVCGDGYPNELAGEQCDSSGVDAADCNGATCTFPRCGDGYVNAAAGEDCETGELCDMSTCTYSFRVGGGCAGCGVGGPDISLLACMGLLLLRRRRR